MNMDDENLSKIWTYQDVCDMQCKENIMKRIYISLKKDADW